MTLSNPVTTKLKKNIITLTVVGGIFFAADVRANEVWCDNCATELTQADVLLQVQSIADDVGQIAGAINSGISAQTSVLTDVTTKLNQTVIDAIQEVPPYITKGSNSQQTQIIRRRRDCAQTLSDQLAARVADTAQDTVRLLVKAQGMAGANAGANMSSPAYIAGDVDDLCKLGFIDARKTGRYGAIPSNIPCKDLSSGSDARLIGFINADMDIGSVIDKLQYPLPVSVKLRRTGQLSFIGANSAESGPGLGSELDFVAAYKFCEHLMPILPTPTKNNGTVTVADYASIKSDRDQYALRTAAANECFRAIAYRMSCPSQQPSNPDSTASTGGATQGVVNTAASGLDCIKDQQALCKRLTDSFENGGHAFSFAKDNPVLQKALGNCSTAGLSRAMYDAIMAYRCHDDNYVQNLNLNAGGDATKVEHMRQFECQEIEEAYLQRMENERERLEITIQNIIMMRGTGGSSGGSQRQSN